MPGTPTETDTRRARQHARKVMKGLRVDIEQFMQEEGMQIWQETAGSPREKARRLNELITRMASERFREDLEPWLDDRHEITMRRAGNDSMEKIRQAFQGQIDEEDLIGAAGRLTSKDRQLASVQRQIDAGMLYEDGDSIAEELGDRVSRQLQQGFGNNEPVSSTDPEKMDLKKRVKMVMEDSDIPGRRGTGESGMTIQQKAEMIAHDSVQDAHTSAAHQRYLNNGFRYAEYDAVIDNKTSEVCDRLDGEIIDLVDSPELKPPNHPWCRSDIIPLLELPDGATPITMDDIGQEHLNLIQGTNQFRPTAIDTSEEFNPTVLTEHQQRAEANRADLLG